MQKCRKLEEDLGMERREHTSLKYVYHAIIAWHKLT
jgi:hypothetical protein